MRLTRFHIALVLLLALALLPRALVPAGWMPVVADGSVRLVLCPSRGPLPPTPQPAAPAAHGAHHAQDAHAGHKAHATDNSAPHQGKHQGSGHDPQQPCTFAAAALAWTGADAPPAPQIAPRPAPALAVRPTAVAVGRGLAAPPPPATGPPALT